MQLRIKIDTISKVKEFVATASAMPFDITLKTGRYIVDAKSLMAIFSLDLESPVVACFDTDNVETVMKNFEKWEDKD